MLKKVKHLTKLFMRLSIKMKLLLIASYFALGMMRLFILIMPYRTLSRLMGKENEDSPYTLDKTSQKRAIGIGWAVNIMSKYTPWQSKCYVRALSAQLLLKLFRIPSTLYLGVSKDSNNNLIAHAWLRSGEVYITGAYEKDNYRCVSYFSSL